MGNRISGIILLSAAVMTCGSPAVGQKMYWCDGSANTVNRANLDGSGSEVVVSSGLSTPDGMILDPVNDKIYWAEQGGEIVRADLDGGNVQVVINAGGVPDSVALDLTAGKVYWSESAAARIRRSNLDGSDVETVIGVNANGTHGIAVDANGGSIRSLRNARPWFSRCTTGGPSPCGGSRMPAGPS